MIARIYRIWAALFFLILLLSPAIYAQPADTLINNGQNSGFKRLYYKNGKLSGLVLYNKGKAIFSASFNRKGMLVSETYEGKKIKYREGIPNDYQFSDFKGPQPKEKGSNNHNEAGSKTGWRIEDGMRDGDSLLYVMYYENGEPEGKAVTYYLNGRLQHVSIFENGKHKGISHTYYKDGSIEDIYVHVNGELAFSMRCAGKGYLGYETGNKEFKIYKKGKPYL